MKEALTVEGCLAEDTDAIFEVSSQLITEVRLTASIHIPIGRSSGVPGQVWTVRKNACSHLHDVPIIC